MKINKTKTIFAVTISIFLLLLVSVPFVEGADPYTNQEIRDYLNNYNNIEPYLNASNISDPVLDSFKQKNPQLTQALYHIMIWEKQIDNLASFYTVPNSPEYAQFMFDAYKGFNDLLNIGTIVDTLPACETSYFAINAPLTVLNSTLSTFLPVIEFALWLDQTEITRIANSQVQYYLHYKEVDNMTNPFNPNEGYFDDNGFLLRPGGTSYFQGDTLPAINYLSYIKNLAKLVYDTKHKYYRQLSSERGNVIVEVKEQLNELLNDYSYYINGIDLKALRQGNYVAVYNKGEFDVENFSLVNSQIWPLEDQVTPPVNIVAGGTAGIQPEFNDIDKVRFRVLGIDTEINFSNLETELISMFSVLPNTIHYALQDINFEAHPIPVQQYQSYEWDLGDGIIKYGNNIVHQYSKPGRYLVNLKVTSTTEYTDSISKIVVITNPLTAPVNFANELQGSAPLTVNFDASSTVCNIWCPPSYHWDFGDGQSADGLSTSHTYQYPGTYYPKLTVSLSADVYSSSEMTIKVSSISHDTTSPDSISNFQVTPYQNSVSLSWTNPSNTDFDKVLIVRSTSEILWTPTNGQTYSGNISTDLTVVYNFYGNSSSDVGLSPSTTYYYKAFAYDQTLNYSTGVSLIVTTLPLSGPTDTTVGNLTGSTGSSSASLSWTQPLDANYRNYLVVRGSWSPSNDTDYNVGENGIICKGAGTSCNDGGLNMGTEYHYAVYSYHWYQVYDDINNVWVTHIHYGSGVSIDLRTQLSGTLSSNLTLSKTNNPHIVAGQVVVPEGITLTIEPGAVVKFQQPGGNVKAGIIVQGTLIADGMVTEPIVFTSVNDNSIGGATGNGMPNAGDWDKIKFESTSTNSLLRWVVVKYGGFTGCYWECFNGIYFSCCATDNDIGAIQIYSSSVTIEHSEINSNNIGIYVENASPTILASNILNNSGQGIYLNNASPVIQNSIIKENTEDGIKCVNGSLPVVEGNTFDSNGNWAVWMASSGAHINNNTFIGSKPFIGIAGGTLLVNTTWTSNAPYIVTGPITVPQGITLTIEAGAIVKFNRPSAGGWCNVGDEPGIIVKGTLIADGTIVEPIIFTSVNDHSSGGATGNGTPNTGDWDKIKFESTSINSLLRHVIVKYGGFTGTYCEYQCQWSMCYNSDGDAGAIQIYSSSVSIANSEINSNNGGIYISGAIPLINDNNISGNTGYGLLNADSTKIVIAQNNNWGSLTGPYDPSDDRATGGWYNPSGLGNKVSDRVNYYPWTGLSDTDGDGYFSDVDCDDNNLTVYPGAPDVICDGVDNNCNGIPDDGYVPSNTSCGVGICASVGQLICQNGAVLDTCTPGLPTGSDNNCNGIDENCNGIADENYVSTTTTCGMSACARTGALVCHGGQLVDTCTPGQPAQEIPNNGIDEDCDGVDLLDADLDGVADSIDNCPTTYNPDQADSEMPDAISYWKFDEGSGSTVNDSTGSNDGTIFGTVWDSGKSGSALNFNGVNDYVVTPNIASYFTDETITVEVWFTAYGDGVIVDELGQSTINTGWHDSQIEIMSTGEVKVRTWMLPSVSLGIVTFGTWHHVVLRYDKAISALDGFLDGVEVSTDVIGNRLAPWGYGYGLYYAFGATDGTNLGSGKYFSGIIDEVAIYSRAISASEVKRHYMQVLNGDGYSGDGVGDTCDNCVALNNPDQEDSNNDGIGDACAPICTDADSDGYSIDGGNCGPVDCNDGNVAVHPGATEIYDGIDNDCNGSVDEGCNADLYVSSFSAPSSATTGQTISVSDTTNKSGAGVTGTSTTKIYLSTDNKWWTNDTYLGSRAVSAFGSGKGSSSSSTDVIIPTNGVCTKTYYLIARADADKAVSEWNEGNNNKAVSIQITNSNPSVDLYVSGVTAPGSANAGDTISVSDTTNKSGCAAGASTTRVYLSKYSSGYGGIEIGSGRTVPAFTSNPGAQTNSGSIIGTIPSGGCTGSCYIVVKADADGAIITEWNEGNNKRATPITITSP